MVDSSLGIVARHAALTVFLSFAVALSGCGEDATGTEDETPDPDPPVTELRYVDIEITGSMTSGDFDGDGFTDLVFTIRTLDGFPAGGNIDMFRVVYGDGAGGYDAETTDIVRLGSSDSTKRGHSLIAARINGDSIDDFVFAAGNVLEVFAGDPVRDHPPVYRTDLVSRVIGQPVYAVDADADNDLDLLTLHFDLILQNNEAGAFVSTETIDSPLITPINFLLADFSGDDIEDVLAIGMPNVEDLGLGLFLGDDSGFNLPAGVDSLSSDLFLGGFVFDDTFKEMAAGDFDGDTDLDVVITSTSNFLQIMINDSTGRFTEGPRVRVASGSIHVRVADFDRDGELDLAALHPLTRSVVISTGNGDGTFEDLGEGAIEIELDGEFDLFDMEVVDIDGDGFPDILFAEDGSNPPDTGRGSIQILLDPTN